MAPLPVGASRRLIYDAPEIDLEPAACLISPTGRVYVVARIISRSAAGRYSLEVVIGDGSELGAAPAIYNLFWLSGKRRRPDDY